MFAEFDHKLKFFGYYQKKNQFLPMAFRNIKFLSNGEIEGMDLDDGGNFMITGTHNEKFVKFTKEYIGKHKIDYDGSFDNSNKCLIGKWHIGEIEGEYSVKLVDRIFKFNGVTNHLGVETKTKGLFASNEDDEVEGKGIDDGGAFYWEGKIEEGNKLRATKTYLGKGVINYEGDIEGLMIKGRYNVEDEIGDFEFVFEDSIIMDDDN